MRIKDRHEGEGIKYERFIYLHSTVVEVKTLHGVLKKGDNCTLEVEGAGVFIRRGTHLLHLPVVVRKPGEQGQKLMW